MSFLIVVFILKRRQFINILKLAKSFHTNLIQFLKMMNIKVSHKVLHISELSIYPAARLPIDLPM